MKARLILTVLTLYATTASTREDRPRSTPPPPPPCEVLLGADLPLRCISFAGHLYAVTDIDLRSYRIVFTQAAHGTETYSVIADELSRSGTRPLLMTNGGIYGTSNKPLGLLISPTGKQHGLKPRIGLGNFYWNSAVFQIRDDGEASIVPARSWQDDSHVIGATQSGPQLASMGTVNQTIPRQSAQAHTRTAIGVDRSDPRLVHLTVSRESVTVFELANFMVNELHCSAALHLDGSLSAFYIPDNPGKFIFSDPGPRIVTVLSVLAKEKPDDKATAHAQPRAPHF